MLVASRLKLSLPLAQAVADRCRDVATFVDDLAKSLRCDFLLAATPGISPENLGAAAGAACAEAGIGLALAPFLVAPLLLVPGVGAIAEVAAGAAAAAAPGFVAFCEVAVVSYYSLCLTADLGSKGSNLENGDSVSGFQQVCLLPPALATFINQAELVR